MLALLLRTENVATSQLAVYCSLGLLLKAENIAMSRLSACCIPALLLKESVAMSHSAVFWPPAKIVECCNETVNRVPALRLKTNGGCNTC